MTRILALLDSERVMRAARIVFLTLLVAGVGLNGIAIRVARNADRHQREGRQVAIQTTCTAISAVVNAGRRALIERGRALGQTPGEYELAAATYARSIATQVAQITRRSDLVNQDGTLDCTRLGRTLK